MMLRTEKSLAIEPTIPFPTQLNLNLVIEKWRKTTSPDDLNRQFIEWTLKENPMLSGPIADPGDLDPYQDFLKVLLAPLIPQSGWSKTLHACCAPFEHKFYLLASSGYKVIQEYGVTQVNAVDNLLNNSSPDPRILYAYKAILKKFYQLDLKVDLPVVLSHKDNETGLNRFFKLTGNTQFVDIELLDTLPDLCESTLQTLLEHDFDQKSWMKLLPPEKFLFKGIVHTTLLDITIEESTRRLQFALLNRARTDDENWFRDIQQDLRNLLRLPALRLGIATLQKDGRLNFSSKKKIRNSLIVKELPNTYHQQIEKSFYQNVLENGQTLIYENLREEKQCHLMKAMVKAGVHNFLLVPLLHDGQVIGLLELTSPAIGAINGLSLFKINQLKPIFANALQRHTEGFENKVEAVMLEEFTAIHPAIKWRFREASINLLDKKGLGGPIRFEKLYPFYGSVDIRDSSRKRNRSIYLDLKENLKAAKEILEVAINLGPLAILEELIFQLDAKLPQSNQSFHVEDEAGVTEFITKKINPIIKHLGTRYEPLRESIAKYHYRLNSDIGVFDSHRLAYEKALQKVNTCISNVLEQEESDLQGLVPCYFVKYQTDGLEYDIYLGKSIAPHLPFDELYIDNLRLRQLIWTCNIVRQIGLLKLESEHAKEDILEVAPLIFSHGSQIALEFRLDEKRLDIAGSYNVRYEIAKKRIDKSIIKGTKERLTQPDHIAIVYSSEQDAVTYRRHFHFLAAQGLIEPEWQAHELEPLQGIEGLHALRIRIKSKN